MPSHPKRIYLSPPHMSGRELDYIKKAFDQNWIAPLGPNVDAFETSLSSACQVDHSVVLSSGTAAIHLALIVLGIKRGDDVIASTFTFAATINPIIYTGAQPILIDSEPQTWNLDPELLEETIKKRTRTGKKPKAIILVHLYGMPSKLTEITNISKRYDIPIIEDAAEALGSSYMNKPLGSFGEIAVLSFNGNKIITTSGGGALLSRNESLVDKARFLATQARDKAPHYQHSEIGYNYRMSNILAGVGLGQMEVLAERVKRKREIFDTYKKKLEKYEGISFQEEPNDGFYSNRWLTTLIVDPEKSGFTCEDLYAEFEKNNIESRPLWKPMHLQPVHSSCPSYMNGTAESLFKNGLCLPSGSNMSQEDISRVLKVIDKQFIKKAKSKKTLYKIQE